MPPLGVGPVAGHVAAAECRDDAVGHLSQLRFPSMGLGNKVICSG